MTMIDVDTSPLEAAREWRGIGLVAAAMNAGLPMAQAEALEQGDPSAFGSIDEMIAAAVVYGASLGIGRDEAMALLDRTVCGTGAKVELPDSLARPNSGFSGAVHERSARIAGRDALASSPLAVDGDEGGSGLELEGFEVSAPVSSFVVDPLVEEPRMPASMDRELPAVPHGPTPEQAVAASGELHLGEVFGPEAPWERSGHTSELEAWAEDFRDAEADVEEVDRPSRFAGVGPRIAGGAYAAIERVLGTEKADAAGDWARDAVARSRELTRDWRERLRRSEHATLIVAIGAGAVLIALVVAIGGALGGGESTERSVERAAQSEPAVTTPEPAVEAPEPAAKPTPAAAAPAPILPPAKLTVDVFNAGSKKGYAKEVAAKLDAAGYRIGEVTNAKSDYAGATIIHPKDMAREAKVLARRTGIATLQEAPGTTRRITIVVT